MVPIGQQRTIKIPECRTFRLRAVGSLDGVVVRNAPGSSVFFGGGDLPLTAFEGETPAMIGGGEDAITIENLSQTGSFELIVDVLS